MYFSNFVVEQPEVFLDCNNQFVTPEPPTKAARLENAENLHFGILQEYTVEIETLFCLTADSTFAEFSNLGYINVINNNK